ncbi:MAG: phosphate acyltransferase PlsX [Dehalococcoidales bacterium]|nr:phosphate acyltransferase PlsX [Dehalococcoidales bacterium]
MTEPKPRVSIAIDAMGGDYAPQEIVAGAVAAAQKNNLELILVGPLSTLEEELAKHDAAQLPIRCVDADFVIKEAENPALAVRRKPNSSIAIATKLVKSGEASAIVGATATGSLVTSALQYLGTIPGVDRPVIGGVLSTLAPKTAIFDLGVNMDCKPHHLLTFAVIGTVYARTFLGIPKPTVALLNVGAEESKGNRLVREAYQLLKKSGLNFIGNVEGHAILTGEANVIVCDAFTGNCVFKLSESGGQMVAKYFLEKINKYPVIGHLIKRKGKKAVASLASPNSIGGGLIWGIDGVVLKMHGHSRAPAVVKSIENAQRAVESDVINNLKAELAKIQEHINV